MRVPLWIQSKPLAYRSRILFATLVGSLVTGHTLQASQPNDWDDAHELFLSGQYAECMKLTAAALTLEFDDEDWQVLHAKVRHVLGLCPPMGEELKTLMDELPRSVHLRFEIFRGLRACGEETASKLVMAEIVELSRRSVRYRDAESRTTLGRVAVILGAEPKDVLDQFLEPAKERDDEAIQPRIAIAELALSKHDYAMAADELRIALSLQPNYAEPHYLLARALASSDSSGSGQALDRALELNPAHADSLLLAADQRIGAELYEEARDLIERVLAVDATHPEAWAYVAVLAHLAGDQQAEVEARSQALSRWTRNPRVDHVIGRELSQKYRFLEGAAYQRRALALDPANNAARFELAQDLLRLGEEAEGWDLAETALDNDSYNVVAYNLMVLHDVLDGYKTLRRDDLIVRMDPVEAEVYGERVLDLLVEARKELGQRYRVSLDKPILLEVFAEQRDFAIRTFGLPGGDGFLGVCFGDVITMNSPAALRATPNCWESVLWHEFCHVVTLNSTHNKMPRWLSEGISVYEERRKNPSWGQVMTPAYRELVLAGDITPVSQLSSAFLRPESPMALQFAYYESSIVIEYMVESFGFDALLAILGDLGRGRQIADSFTNHALPPDELDSAFELYFRQCAEDFASGASWDTRDQSDLDLTGLALAVGEDPSHVPTLIRAGEAMLQAGMLEQAIPMLKRAVKLAPTLIVSGGAYGPLANAYAQASDVEQELVVLEAWMAHDASQWMARMRAIELYGARSDWAALLEVALSARAIQPMSQEVQRQIVRAAAELGRPHDELAAGKALLALEPTDLAGVHYQVAQAAYAIGDRVLAKHHVLRALESAPRFLAAHGLLLELVDGPSKSPETGSKPGGSR
ncbi:MAG: tetratricopeptide (TPR) repeat protein [Planctomycetota bacterium]|jgi:tetratricopeptide (TPR) repeat protein